MCYLDVGLEIPSSHSFHIISYTFVLSLAVSPNFWGYFHCFLLELGKQSGLVMFCLAASSSFVLVLRILCPATESDRRGFWDWRPFDGSRRNIVEPAAATSRKRIQPFTSWKVSGHVGIVGTFHPTFGLQGAGRWSRESHEPGGSTPPYRHPHDPSESERFDGPTLDCWNLYLTFFAKSLCPLESWACVWKLQ